MDFNEWWDNDNGNEDLKQQCENLLQSSNFDDDTKAQLENDLWGFHEEELNQMRAMLLMNQTDRIESGHNYTQRDINNKLKHI